MNDFIATRSQMVYYLGFHVVFAYIIEGLTKIWSKEIPILFSTEAVTGIVLYFKLVFFQNQSFNLYLSEKM